MKNWLVIPLGLMAMFLMMGCGGGKVLDHVELDAFKEGKPQGRMIMELAEHTFDDGTKGMLLTTEVKMSIGSRNRVHSISKVIMKEDYSFYSMEKVATQNDTKTEIEMMRTGDIVTVVKSVTGREDKTEKAPVKGKFVGDLHHTMYAKDMTKKGTENTYNIFFEPMRQVVALRVRYLEDVSLSEGGETIECKRFGVQSMAKPGKFDDYYVSQKGHHLVRVNLGEITLKPKAK